MKGNNLNELKVVLKGYDVWRWAWVGSLTLSVCVWWKVVALLLFGPHGCIQTPLDQQLFMSDGKVNKTEKHQIRLGSIFMPSCSVFFNHTDTNATFALSRTGHFDPVCNYCQQNVEGPWNTRQFPFQSFTYRSIPEQVISIQFHVKVPGLWTPLYSSQLISGPHSQTERPETGDRIQQLRQKECLSAATGNSM